MNNPARFTVSAEIDADTHGLLQQVVAATGRTEAEFVAAAVQDAAERKAEYLAFIQEGIDSADRGNFVSHAAVMAELDAMIEKHRARCQN